MPESGDLLSLLETLGKTHSPSAKLRLLGNSWKLLRDLTPKQRQRLFAAQGLKQAGDLLRRAGGREERSADLLLALADQVEKADVDKLGKLFDRVRKGGFSELIEDGLSHFQEQILGSKEQDESPPLTLDPLPLDLEPPMEAEPPPVPPPEVPADLPGMKTREKARVEAPLQGKTSAPPDDEPIVADGPPSEPQVHRSAAVDARSAAESRGAKAQDQEEGWSEPAEQVARQEIEVEPEDLWSARSVETTRLREPGSILEQLSAERSLLHRFRLVRDRLAELSNSPDLAQAVEEFPPGWARRRFVTQLIRQGDVGFEQSCQLLQQLPASGEHWGVSAILERFPIDTARLNALQQVVRSPLSKRRVQRHRL